MATSPVGVGAALALAVALPMLVAYNQPPLPTFFNQLGAFACWAAALVAAGAHAATPGGPAARCTVAGLRSPCAALLAALLIVACAAAFAVARLALPASLGLSAGAALALAALCVGLGWRVASSSTRGAASGLAWGCLIAGALSTAIALVQVMAPALADGTWVARSMLAGRGVGNLRQPNHLATLMLLATIAVVPLASRGRWPPRWPPAWVGGLVLWMILGVALSASRTGALCTVVLAVWGLADRRLARHVRWMLGLSPVMLAALWFALDLASAQSVGTFAGASRLHADDISASRFAIWRDTLALIAAHPWAGVGFGRFNLAWSMTPFPQRPTAFFDHAHNLPLQLVAELGVPLGLLVCGLLVAALWRAWRRASHASGEYAVLARSLLMMALMMAIHSMLEYPLWYAHFLLPTAFALGVCLGWPALDSGPEGQAPPTPSATAVTASVAPWLAIAGVVALLVSSCALVDYARVSSIFQDAPRTTSLAQRIDAGQRSLFFAHHAHYARATTAERPGEVMDSIDVAKYHLLDTRLMVAWARAYAERGDLDRARYVAARLREFKNPGSREFFAACTDGAAEPRPFQCDPPARVFTWQDFAGPQ